jgi:hypothetical protein
MNGLVALYGGSAPHHRGLHEPKYARWLDRLVYLPDLAWADLSAVDAIIVPERLHRGMLHAGRQVLLDLLERGGTVVVFGEQPVYGDMPDGWLPGIRWEYRPTNYWWWRDAEPHSGLVGAAPDHDLFRHLTLADATWHQHGVFRPPDGAETVLATDDGGAVLYVDEVSTPGTLVVTSLDPLYHFGSHFMPATERFLDGFLPWLAEDLLARPRRSDPAITGVGRS